MLISYMESLISKENGRVLKNKKLEEILKAKDDGEKDYNSSFNGV